MYQYASLSGLFAAWIVVTTLTGQIVAAEPNGRRVEFNRDIRPILSDKCFTCHGPDSAKRKAGLRLDRTEDATAERDGARAIMPGDLAKSEVVRRIVSRDPDEQMPPPKSNLSLTEKEVSLIQQWIEQGAEYQLHWAFIAPRAVIPPADVLLSGGRQSPGSSIGPQPPPLANSPIDSFIRSRLVEVQLTPSPAADRPTLLRRVSFDLIGLPPTLEEIDQFVADSSPDAFERQIDRLLASPRYGERMATIWLDAARYADTNGYQTDGPRFMWRWRDWVIDAFNRNQPYDEFTIDQLAGDLVESEELGARNSEQKNEKDESAGVSSSLRTPRSALRTSSIADDRLIATGFNRNHRSNAEGGIIPEEFRVEYVVDRVETTSTVWLGLTIGCTRCHDHKYDPISQREFYQLFAFFNQVPEPGKSIRNDNSMPYLPAPTADQQARLAVLEQELNAAKLVWHGLALDVATGVAKMSTSIREAGQSVDWAFSDGLDSHIAFDGDSQVSRLGQKSDGTDKTKGTDQSQASHSSLSTETTLPATWHDGVPVFVDGRIGQAAEFDGLRWMEAGDVGDFGENDAFAISLWLMPRGREVMTVFARMDEVNAFNGYELIVKDGHLQAIFSGRILDDLIRVEAKQPLPENVWSHVIVTYDGQKAARGVSIRVNGTPVELTVITDLLSNPFKNKQPLRIGAGGSAKPFDGRIDELRFYRGLLTDEVALSLAVSETVSQLAAAPFDATTPRQDVEKLHEYYLRHHAPEAQRHARQNVLDARSRYFAYLATIPTTMVMQDQPGLRETRILTRGEYDKPGELVQPGVPAVLPSLERATSSRATSLGAGDVSPLVPASRSVDAPDANTKNQGTHVPRSEGNAPSQAVPLNRLDLARWMVSPENPLTARVTVNRLWQMLFGVGLVKTPEDFGTQGELPSHPELLDWLAVEFGGSAERGVRSAGRRTESASATATSSAPRSEFRAPSFDIKRTLRQLVTSATYRQSSHVDEALLARDSNNRWLARGPRFRLSAEMIRDAALASSGLLVESLGGPSVKPYQPPGLWEELGAEAVPGPFATYVQDHGASLYRRSLYTYQKRTVTTPSMAIFDASSRDFCRVKLPRTNTPLQALTLMNDITYLEAARVLAEHALRDGGATAESRITWAFRRVLSRPPHDNELRLLVRGLDRRRRAYQQEPTLAQRALQIGESPACAGLSPDELAAYAATISVMFNVDEFVERP